MLQLQAWSLHPSAQAPVSPYQAASLTTLHLHLIVSCQECLACGDGSTLLKPSKCWLVVVAGGSASA